MKTVLTYPNEQSNSAMELWLALAQKACEPGQVLTLVFGLVLTD